MSTATRICIFFALIAPMPVSGALIADDSFNYPTGAIVNRNGGVGFSGAYSGNGNVVAGSLAYTDAMGRALPTDGGHVSTIAGTSGMFRSLNFTPGSTLGSTIYIGFLARLQTGTNLGYGGISFFNGSTEELFFGDPGDYQNQGSPNHTHWGVDPQQGPSGVGESKVLVDSTTHFLVGRVDFLQSTGAVVRFYVDPTLSSEPNTPSVGPFSMPDFRFDRLRIESGTSQNGTGTHSFDEIRIGTTFADVVPEPGSICGLSFMLTLLRRPRRRERKRPANP